MASKRDKDEQIVMEYTQKRESGAVMHDAEEYNNYMDAVERRRKERERKERKDNSARENRR